MLRIRGQEDMERYDILIDEQLLISWDTLLKEENSLSNGMYNRKHTWTDKV